MGGKLQYSRCDDGEVMIRTEGDVLAFVDYRKAAPDDEQIAARIVRAVNAHEHLIAALEEAHKRIAESIGDHGGILGRIEAALLYAKYGDQI